MENDDSPPWPSLYSPGIELLFDQGPTQPNGVYLHHAVDVFRFTLFWTLIFYTPLFAICGIYAFLNLSFPPSILHSRKSTNEPEDAESYPLSPIAHPHRQASEAEAESPLLGRPSSPTSVKRNTNKGRSRVTFALLVLLVFSVTCIAGALTASAVVGFVLYGLFAAAKFSMSTWVPFLWALIHTLVGYMR